MPLWVRNSRGEIEPWDPTGFWIWKPPVIYRWQADLTEEFQTALEHGSGHAWAELLNIIERRIEETD